MVSLYDGCLFSHAEATASHIIGSALFVAAEKDIAMKSWQGKMVQNPIIKTEITGFGKLKNISE